MHVTREPKIGKYWRRRSLERRNDLPNPNLPRSRVIPYLKSPNVSHETTSTALGWALYELSEHPEVQTRLRKEIHSVLGKSFDPHRRPTNEQLDQLKYLNNVCREVLRVDPPGTPSHCISNLAPITARQAVADDVYEGVKIPKDSIIHFPHLVINMSTEIWGPDAAEFRPERWDNLKDVPNTHFMTFQHGICFNDSADR
jgi:cytochrome P450